MGVWWQIMDHLTFWVCWKCCQHVVKMLTSQQILTWDTTSQKKSKRNSVDLFWVMPCFPVMGFLWLTHFITYVNKILLFCAETKMKCSEIRRKLQHTTQKIDCNSIHCSLLSHLQERGQPTAIEGKAFWHLLESRSDKERLWGWLVFCVIFIIIVVVVIVVGSGGSWKGIKLVKNDQFISTTTSDTSEEKQWSEMFAGYFSASRW